MSKINIDEIVLGLRKTIFNGEPEIKQDKYLVFPRISNGITYPLPKLDNYFRHPLYSRMDCPKEGEFAFHSNILSTSKEKRVRKIKKEDVGIAWQTTSSPGLAVVHNIKKVENVWNGFDGIQFELFFETVILLPVGDENVLYADISACNDSQGQPPVIFLIGECSDYVKEVTSNTKTTSWRQYSFKVFQDLIYRQYRAYINESKAMVRRLYKKGELIASPVVIAEDDEPIVINPSFDMVLGLNDHINLYSGKRNYNEKSSFGFRHKENELLFWEELGEIRILKKIEVEKSVLNNILEDIMYYVTADILLTVAYNPETKSALAIDYKISDRKSIVLS